MRACCCCGKGFFLSMGGGLKSFFFRKWFWDWVCFFFNWGSWVGKDGEEMHVGEVENKKR